MTRLVLNAAEASLDIVLGRDNDIICAQSWRVPHRGTEILVPALHGMLRQLGMRPADIGQMACVCGPGSFTGVRLTLTTAAALRRVCGMPLAGLDFMQALALRGQRSSTPAAAGGWVWALTHARRDLVHCQPFARGEEHLPPQALSPVELCSPANAARRMADESPAGSVMLGTGVQRNAHTLEMHCAAVPQLASTAPLADDLWTLALHAAYAHTDIEPRYVRPCDAVENLDHIARKQGNDPAAAHARLDELLHAPCAPV